MERKDDSIRNLRRSDHYTLALHFSSELPRANKENCPDLYSFYCSVKDSKCIRASGEMDFFFLALSSSRECIMWFLNSRDM